VAAVASAAVGAYFEVASYSSAHDVEHARAVTTPGVCAATPATGSCITLMGKVSDTGTNTVASEIAYGVGAVFAAGAVVTWVLGGPRAATVGSMRVRPMVGPRSLGVNGTF
jgi:Flp pilus assembly CpaE family ATPase